MTKNSILLILPLGMMSGGFYNNVFATNVTQNTVKKECVLTGQEADKLIEKMKKRKLPTW